MDDFRPPPRIKDVPLLKLLKLECDECELSGLTTGLHLHHVIYKSHGGDDVRSNIVCMNDELHRAYHQGDTEVRAHLGWLVHKRRLDTANYIAAKLGGGVPLLEWFARHSVVVSA